MPARPAITIKIDSTAAKIGRSMKKRDIMPGSLLLGRSRRLLWTFRRLLWTFRRLLWTFRRLLRTLRGLLRCLGGPLAALARRSLGAVGRVGIADLHRPARRPHQLELHHAVDDDALAGFQSAI